LNLSISESHLSAEWGTDKAPSRTYEVYEKKHWITQEYWGAYVRHNQIYRRVFDFNGAYLEDEWITENHAMMMYSPYLPGGKEPHS
jgi:vancomycin resistance protein VanW